MRQPWTGVSSMLALAGDHFFSSRIDLEPRVVNASVELTWRRPSTVCLSKS